MTPQQLRKLATYLQYRLDRAGAGPMKFEQAFVAEFIEVVELAQKAAREPEVRQLRTGLHGT